MNPQTLNPNQVAFNYVWSMMHQQKQAAICDNLNVCFRVINNKRDPIGFMLSDYGTEMEFKDVDTLLREQRLDQPFNRADRNLLATLEDVHDKTVGEFRTKTSGDWRIWRRAWRKEMRRVADQYNLHVPPVPYRD